MSTPNLTPEQSAILDAIAADNSNLLIEARAGSGKTFVLVKSLPLLRGSTVLMAFNKSIATELQARTADLDFATRAQLDVSTVHALGLRAYSKGNGRKPRIAAGKVSFIIKDLLASNSDRQQYFHAGTSIIGKMVGSAKSSGVDLIAANEEFPSSADDVFWKGMLAHNNFDIDLEQAHIAPERAIALAQEVLTISNKQRDIIDFDDMIYLPLLLGHQLPQYDNVLIDEAQDISATRREMAFRMMKPTGRLIAVGDEYQAIYGFTGADAESLANIARRGSCQQLPLTTCWRCDGEIITAAQRFVPDIRARPDAGPGAVHKIPYASLVGLLGGTAPPEKLDAAMLALTPQPGDAILCRLNKPNVSLALSLIRSGKRARIEGRDLGKKLIQHVKASTPMYAFQSLPELIINVEDYGAEACRLLASKERLAQADLLEDEISCAVLLLERANEQPSADFETFENLIADMFADDIPANGTITLSSVHKAKGREWHRVYILGRYDYMPFHRAIQDWEKQQERNLIYVATTRAEKELVLITDVQSYLDGQKGR